MPKSRDVNQISATSLEDLQNQLNFILQRFSDRLDKLEGIRDSFATESGGSFGEAVAAPSFEVADEDSETIHAMGG